ncbi:amidohydrolase family protein [Jiella pelagia]|uniref:Amidohydrolase family protein n=1 Tax=Jiella pelagia TaxID=2986949 RepID=A0ABY7C355_9HYPH|nr:amidohydrolase family protein [Jiella pelagia]WAP68270.1 amidohydrolase family protein [Jiella pelagia]
MLLRRYCGHVAVFNTAAMRLLAIAEDAPDPEFGHFERLPDGRLNGTAVEQAAEAIFRAAPAPAPHLLRQGIRDAIDDCLKLGLTALTEAAVGFSIGHDREDAIWNAVRAEGDLPLRMGFMAQLTALEAAERQLTPIFDRRWSRETLKFFADGIVGGRTSALSEPFCDRGGTGTFMLPESVLTEEILAAHAAGWRVAVHATGDRAIERVASAYEDAEASGAASRRHRIEHCFCPPPGLFERLRKIDALVVMQPSFLWRMGPSIVAGLGRRTETAYPGRSVIESGARLVLSSDAPTGLLSPWEGVRSAVERLSSDGTILGEGEAITVREAIDAAIAGGAAAMRHEGFRGRLDTGFAADLAVFDRDPFSLAGAELAATRATLTMVDGKIVHHDA